VATPADSAPTRLRVSFRASLLVVLPLFVLATSGVITLRSWVTTERTIERVSRSMFREVTRQTASRTRAHLGAAAPTLDVLTALEQRDVRASDRDVLPRLLAMLRANPGYSWVSYGDREGGFAAAYRPDEAHIRLNTSAIVDGHTILDERDLLDDGTTAPYRHEDDSHYDPRTRPWYRAALEAGHRTWMPPYVFFHQGIAGITCASPQRDAHGAIVGVYTVDFDLGALSRFVAELGVSEHGEVFVFTGEGELVAHPTRATVVGESGSEDGRIVRLDDLDESPMPEFRAALAENDHAHDDDDDGDEVRTFAFDARGERWLASVTSFEVDQGLRWRVGAIAPASDFLAELQQENRISVTIGIAALLFAVLLAVYLANRIARPLDDLAVQMDRVGRFELGEGGIAGTIFREIDAMTTALSRMKSGLGSFARFVPRDLVRSLLASGHEARLGGEMRTLSIFFSDIAGFTSFAESLPPDELVQRLGSYLDAMTRTIARESGTVDKYLGDGIMAFWGAPEPDAAHARHACEAALECQRVLRTVAEEPSCEWIAQARTRIGVATGVVLVGNFGTPERMNYTVMGDVANLASRLEGLNKQYGTYVLVDEATMRGAEPWVIGRPIDLVAVKGKSHGVRVYELLARDTDADADAARALAKKTEEALAAYLARDFARAAALYRALEAERGDDPAARTMRARAEAYLEHPPPDGWDGVYVAKEK
jgi:adenylate cyclase